MGTAHAHDPAHGHGHAHGHGDTRRSLWLSLAVTVLFMGVEAAAGWWANSLALLSDAGHMFTDAAALGLSLAALGLARRPATATKTFGYRRVELLAALLNGFALWGVVGMILHEAWGRLARPEAVNGAGMAVVAALGLCVNLISLTLLHRHRHESLNVRGAFLHVLADSLGSAGALAAGLVVWKTGWTAADPLVSVCISALILWSSWGLVREAVHGLLLGVPPHLDYREVERAFLDVPGVCCVYDLHLWSIATGQDALSAHVVVAADALPRSGEVLAALSARLRERFGIGHVTLQLEPDHGMKDEHGGTCGMGGTCAPGEKAR